MKPVHMFKKTNKSNALSSQGKRGETKSRGEKPTVKTVLVSFQDHGSKVYTKKHKSNIFGVSMEGTVCQ